MSSSKRKRVVDKSANDDKSKPSVFDRLGPGLTTRTAEPEVNYWKSNLVAISISCNINVLLQHLSDYFQLFAEAEPMCIWVSF